MLKRRREIVLGGRLQRIEGACMVDLHLENNLLLIRLRMGRSRVRSLQLSPP